MRVDYPKSSRPRKRASSFAPPSEPALAKNFRQATRLKAAFWQIGLEMSGE
ncbi:MAG: hypothetical protein HYW28_08540 [Rhodospirillales bacterium]|nr:hypothetical protein [Rhodospirillales bacterium]